MGDELVTVDPHRVHVASPAGLVRASMAQQRFEEPLLLGFVPNAPPPVMNGFAIGKQLAPLEDGDIEHVTVDRRAKLRLLLQIAGAILIDETHTVVRDVARSGSRANRPAAKTWDPVTQATWQRPVVSMSIRDLSIDAPPRPRPVRCGFPRQAEFQRLCRLRISRPTQFCCGGQPFDPSFEPPGRSFQHWIGRQNACHAHLLQRISNAEPRVDRGTGVGDMQHFDLPSKVSELSCSTTVASTTCWSRPR